MHITYLIYTFAHFTFVKCIASYIYWMKKIILRGYQPTKNFYQYVILFKLNATEEREPAAL